MEHTSHLQDKQSFYRVDNRAIHSLCALISELLSVRYTITLPSIDILRNPHVAPQLQEKKSTQRYTTERMNHLEVKTPIKAIRAKCLDCCCDSMQEVRLCPISDCPLHPYRFGHRPKKGDLTDNDTNTTGSDQGEMS